MNRRIFFGLLLVAMGAWAGANAAEFASKEEAKALAEKAAAFLKANGPEKAFAAFEAADGGFRDRDLYVVVQDNKGVMVSHATNPGLKGKSVLDLKDVDGKPFNREWQAVKDAAWVDYKWQNPQTKAVAQKSAYIIHVGDYLLGVGAYVK
jgi:signal transduction histidine kinase